MENNQQENISASKESLSTPTAIIIAGLFIAIAIYLTAGKTSQTPEQFSANSAPKFSSCLASGKFASRVAIDSANAQLIGGQGTPWTIVIGKNGIKYPISGAESAENIEKVVNDAIAGNSNKSSINVVKSYNKAFDPASLEKINPVTPADHILGDPNALVYIVEYSDLECPFCKMFHSTLHDFMTYEVTRNVGGVSVAWVYRHFPLNIHPKSEKESEAAECAFEQGGNDAFWKYIDRVYEVTTSNNTLDPLQLPIIAKYIGLK